MKFKWLIVFVTVGIFVCIIALHAAYFGKTKVTARFSSPQPNQVFVINQSNTIDWDTVPDDTKLFSVIFLLDEHNNIVGNIGAVDKGVSQYIWNTSVYYTGDMGFKVHPGTYKFKVVGYDKLFCFNGECGPQTPKTAKQLFEVISYPVLIQSYR